MSNLEGTRGAMSVWFTGLSHRPLRVLLTVLGIASGVALSFAVAAQNASLTSGSANIYRELAGGSKLELVALGPEGMPLATAERVRRLPGVAAAAPVSEELINVRHGRRSVNLRLLGVDGHIRSLGGALARDVPVVRPGGTIGLYISPHIKSELNVDKEAEVDTYSRIGPTPTYIAGILPTRQLGAMATTSVVFATLSLSELLTGSESRIQRVLIIPRGHPQRLAQSIERVGGPGTVVWSTATEARAADQASELNRSSSSLFAAMSLVVGGLLAYSAMVLTMAERRREVAVLRVLGCGIGPLLFAVLADALLLGTAGTMLGLLAGRLTLGWLLPSDNSFLSSAFLLDSKVVVPFGIVVLGFAAGIATTLLAAALPAVALARVAPADALRSEPEYSMIGVRAPTGILLALAVTLGVIGLLLTISGHGVLGVPLWVLASLFAVPAAVASVARTVNRLLPSPGGAARAGIAEITAFPSRAIAAAAVVTLAMSGLIIINGAVANLEAGTARLAAASYPTGSLFVTPEDFDQVFFTQPLAAGFSGRLTHLPFVSYVRPWRTAFLDWGERRVLTYAFTEEVRTANSDEFLQGDPQHSAHVLATDPSAVALSSDLASTHKLYIGARFVLPTPAGPKTTHVVAIITNYGWLPGTVALNPQSYATWWGSRGITAYQVGLMPGTNTAVATRLVRARLGESGLTTVTSAQMRERIGTSAKSQLANLQRIGRLIALAGLLAVTAATLAGVLGRIRRVSALRTIGMSLRHVAISIASEAGGIVGAGALLGGLVGIVGHALVIDYLSSKFALNVTFKPSLSQFAVGAMLSGSIVFVATSLALYWAARAPLATSQSEA